MVRYGLLFLMFTAVMLGQPIQKSAAALPKAAPAQRHFISSSGALTEASGDAPSAIALRFIESVAPSLGLTTGDLQGLVLAREYRTEHNGITHLLYRQQFEGVDVVGAAYAVNIDRDGRVVNAGGDLMRRPTSQAPTLASGAKAIRAAVREVNPQADGSYLAAAPAAGEKYARFARGGFANETEGKPVWSLFNGALRPGWLFFVPAENGVDRFATVVDAEDGRVIRSVNTTLYQKPQNPRGLVFERESPQPNPTPGVRVSGDRPYVQRTLQPFTGDPVASPKGWVDGTQTVGNNVVAGSNPIGRRQILDPVPTTAPDGNFSFPLELGPGAPPVTNFVDAATVNLFYWANKAHDRFYAVGFDEAAGNFQTDNFGRGGIGGDPMLAYSQYGVAAAGRAQLDNAFFTTYRGFEDGSRVSINMFLWDGGEAKVFTDGSFDAEVITHEYTHGVSNRLVEGVYENFQGASMGEAWSDYFSKEFTVPENTPLNGVFPAAEYPLQTFGVGIRSRPFSTDMTVNSLTFANFGKVASYGPEVHADGEIWVQALWECRAALIQQFGEKEGRRRMAQIVMDAMKLSVPRPTYVDQRDAVLLADRVNNKGESQTQLWQAFAKRGLGVVASTTNPDAATGSASFATPSKGGTLRFEWDQYTMGDPKGSVGEPIRVILHDANMTGGTASIQLTSGSGDVESLVLRKKGETYYGTISMGTDGGFQKYDNYLDVAPGDAISAYYVDGDTGAGAKLIQTSAAVIPGYGVTLRRATPVFAPGRESALLSVVPGLPQRITSPRLVLLPFPFKFYGQEYRTAWIFPNGYVNFGYSGLAYTGCNTSVEASQFPTVAPLWTELAYGGPGQRNENVYFSAVPGAFTVRWVAETWATGEPVNFAAVFYDDGKIVFQYGEGNNNVVNSPFFGCGTNTPLIGVSNGHGTFLQSVDELFGSPNLEGFPDVILDPPYNYSSVPVVRVESPEAGGKYAGLLTVKGVAYDPNDPIARLDILIDGVPRRKLTTGIARPDFCITQRVAGCPNVGFQAVLDLPVLGIAPGTHTLQVRASNTRGSIKDYPEQPISFTIDPGQSRLPIGKLEAPVADAAITGSTVLRGYVYAPDVRIVAVDVLVDGTSIGPATYGQPREDVCSTLPTPKPVNCPGIGFTFTLNSVLSAVPVLNGKHIIQVRARDEAGRFTVFPETGVAVTVDNGSRQLPMGVLHDPAPNSELSGTVKIWGWAWDPDGRVVSVTLLVDGIGYYAVNYGDERAAQCATLPDVKACPNIGFWYDFDTRVVPNGLHQLGVRITDDKGNSVVIPEADVVGHERYDS